MRKLAVLPLAALALAACGDGSAPVTAPDGPNHELVDPGQRVAATDVNAWVYGTFSLTFGGGDPGVIRSGPASFPGNPKNAGSCEDGLWINPQGKRTSGSLTRPHPHCVGESTQTVQVVLEPISVKNGNPGQSDNEYLQFTADREDGQVKKVGGGGPNEPNTQGEGTLVAYAIDASTIGTTKTRVGQFTIDLAQYSANQTNRFAENCSLGDVTAPRCLNLVITADYEPLAVGGVGTATNAVTGFLYWTPASQPYNY